MSWLAVHPDQTAKVRVHDDTEAPEFEVGFFPPRESERISVIAQGLHKPVDLDPIANQEEFAKLSGLEFTFWREVAKWGVRGWSGAEQPASVGTEKIDGREHKALSPESIEVLYVNGL